MQLSLITLNANTPPAIIKNKHLKYTLRKGKAPHILHS